MASGDGWMGRAVRVMSVVRVGRSVRVGRVVKMGRGVRVGRVVKMGRGVKCLNGTEDHCQSF